MHKDRFLIIAWPEDHEEELSDFAREIQSVLDMANCGGAQVYMMPPENVCQAIKDAINADDVLPV